MSLQVSIMTGGANSHETTSEEANGIATDFVAEGVIGSITNTSGVAPATGAFAVNAQGTPDMTVAVTSGVAYVQGTPTGQNSQMFRVYSSASEDVTISANSSGSTKYDWIYIKLDADLLADPTLAGTTTATLVASRSSSSTSDDGTPPTYGYPIAVVTVVNGASSISNSAIRDVRAGSSIGNTSVNTTGWLPSQLPNVSSVTNNGNRSYTVTYASTMASLASVGQRHRFTRTVSAPTQSTDLNGSTQYWSKSSPSGISFTDDFVVSAWIYLDAYGSLSSIASRFNGTSGWLFYVDSSGRLGMNGYNAGGSNLSAVLSYQSVPINKWVHVAAQLDMSTFTATTTTSYVMIDGLDVPASVTRSGTNPTALVQAGNLEIGSYNSGTSPFNGKIAQVAIFSAKVTQSTIRTYMSQTMSGSETSCVGFWDFDGDGNDASSNANNLTASGSATATAAYSPFATPASGTPGGTYDYGLVMNVNGTDVTYQVPSGCTIPTSGGVTTVDMATSYAPLGFPVDKGRWNVVSLAASALSTSGSTTNTWYATNLNISAPIGRWLPSYDAVAYAVATSGDMQVYLTLSTGSATESNRLYTATGRNASSSVMWVNLYKRVHESLDISSATTYYLNAKVAGTTPTALQVRGDVAISQIILTPAGI